MLNMHPSADSAPLPQLLVLARGMSDGEPSKPTRERALAAHAYWEQHGEDLGRVVFSGGYASLRNFSVTDIPSEASVMAQIAGLPDDIVRLEEHSNSTVENFIKSAELLDLKQPVGVLAHRVHMRRALFLGSRVMGDARLVPVLAEDYGASPENRISVGTEWLALAKDVINLAGVQSGDREVLKQRANRFEEFKQRRHGLLRAIVGRTDQYN